MNTETGQLLTEAQVKMLSEFEQEKYIPVTRDLTAKETMEMQIRLYNPCACGSGRKFKFCCHRKP